MKKTIISSFSKLSKAEADLIAKHMEVNKTIKFTDVFEGWYDENGDLCIRYSPDEWYHYNVERGEWW